MKSNLVLLAVAVVVAALFAELGLRAFHFVPGVMFVDQADFHRQPGPFVAGQTVFDRQADGRAFRIHINNLGFRGPDTPMLPANNSLRVLLIGDSFTFGPYVKDSETLAGWLQASLVGRCTAVEVVNGGVGGSTIVDQRPLAEHALMMRPGVVLLAIFAGNDIEDMARQPSQWDERSAIREADARFPLSLVHPLHRLALYRVLRWVLSATHGRPRVGPAIHAFEDSATTRLQGRYLAELAALRDSLARVHVPLMAAVFPDYSALSGDDRRESWFVAAVGQLGIPVADLRIPLRRSAMSVPELFLLPKDIHPSATGYRVAAQYWSDDVIAREPFASSCGVAGRSKHAMGGGGLEPSTSGM